MVWVEGADCTYFVSINKGDTLEPRVEEGLVAHGALTRLRQHLAHARVVSDRPPQVRPSETVGITGLNASVNVPNLSFQLVSTFLRCCLQKISTLALFTLRFVALSGQQTLVELHASRM